MKVAKSLKKLCAICILAALTVLTASCFAGATETESTGTAAGQQTTETETEAPALPGSHLVGKKLIDNQTGKAVKGLKGRAAYPAGTKTFYYFKSKKGKIAVSTWIKSGSVKYYATETGELAKGWTKINGKWYYFTAKNKLKTGKFKVQGQYYYANADGSRKTGFVTYKKGLYFFDKKTGAMVTGWKTKKKKTYFFAVTGTKKGQAIKGWLSINGSRYYFNDKGIMQKGWLTLNDKKYYLDPSTGIMQTGTITVNGKSYALGKKGYLTVTVTGPWNIKVNKATNVVTIYRGTTPVKAMLCSVGALRSYTPEGDFTLKDKLRWHVLDGPSYGQYCSHLTYSILFHSVWYYQQDNHTLATAEYNKLGSPASHGCIRLACGDAYYIYVNCPIGTPVKIFWGSSKDDPLGKPKLTKISTNYDPTDPNI